jgi:hypothetical protein
MITVFELKNRPFCRFFYKIPYFIKNLFLLLLLACILVPIYFVHFRKESLGVTNIYKILAGLNSQTFNYLSSHDSKLNIGDNIKSITLAAIQPLEFYSNCVALNRPCFISGMARTWKAFNSWRYSSDGYAYLDSALKGYEFQVFEDDDPIVDSESFTGYSFDKNDKTRLEYTKYLEKMSKQAVGMTLRDSSGQLNAIL